MDKVICDICGTAYPQTADECPICGYPRQDNEKVIARADAGAEAPASREKVKGGRFSNKNVKKRNKAVRAVGYGTEIPAATLELPKDLLEEEPELVAVAAPAMAAPAVAAAAVVQAAEPAAAPVEAPAADEPVTPAAVPAEVPAETPVEAPAEAADETPAPAVTPAAVPAGDDLDDDDLDEDEAADDDLDEDEADEDDPADEAEKTEEASDKPERNPNRPLWITIAILLAAIVLVSLYIGIRFFRNGGGKNPAVQLPQQTTTAPSESTTPSTGPVEIACSAVSLSSGEVKLGELGQTYQLSVTTVPTNTTDAVTYLSSDETVVTVNEEGLIAAVGPGRANVIVSCGNARVVCAVSCEFVPETTLPVETTAPTETTEPTKPTESEDTPAEDGLILSHTDVSLFTKGETFSISAKYDGRSVSLVNVSWSTSDPAIATVDNGRVTGVGPGTATITATYQGEKVVCVVRCRFAGETEPSESTAPNEPSETTEPTESTEETTPQWSISHSDVTLAVDESFTLSLRSGAGDRAEVTWSADKEGVVTISGNRITGVAAGTVTVSCTYEGVSYSCIVRVR